MEFNIISVYLKLCLAVLPYLQLNNNQIMLDPVYLSKIVNEQALAHDLRPDIVMALITKESHANPFANRLEPHYVERLAKKERHELSGWVPQSSQVPNLDTEKNNRSMSWGLMQIMGDTARWIGRVEDPFLTILIDPERNIDVGCRVLSYYLGKENGNYTRALARYNAGSVTPRGLQYAQSVNEILNQKTYLKYFA